MNIFLDIPNYHDECTISEKLKNNVNPNDVNYRDAQKYNQRQNKQLVTA